MPNLTGTGRTADELYLLAHDDVTGKPRLQPRALGVGLAGALLAELVFAEAVSVRADGIALRYVGLPSDDLGRHVIGLLRADREPHPLRDWLLFLGADAEESVARRLERAGYVAETSSRWPRRKSHWMPTDSDCAFAPMIRVKAVMAHTRSATVADVVLSGLALACGLGPRVLPYGPPDARRTVETLIRRLDPAFRELVAQTQAAVDSALLSHRV